MSEEIIFPEEPTMSIECLDKIIRAAEKQIHRNNVIRATLKRTDEICTGVIERCIYLKVNNHEVIEINE